MIISKMEFLDRTQLDLETLEVWIEEEWLVPSGTATESGVFRGGSGACEIDPRSDAGLGCE